MNEATLDRRAHWIQIVITGIVLATGWCMKLEITVSSLKAEADKRADAIENNRKNRDADLLKMENRIRTNEVDLDWLKKGGCNGQHQDVGSRNVRP